MFTKSKIHRYSKLYRSITSPIKANIVVNRSFHQSKCIYCMIKISPGEIPRCISIENLNPYLKLMEYAVRGPIVDRATQIEQELRKGEQKPFTEVIKANLGDCHATGQKPLTFIRQVMAAVTYPALLNDKELPEDVKKKARSILAGCKGQSIGSYTDSPGMELIRRHVAEYIEQRDGIPCNWQEVILSAGASDGIKTVMKLLNCSINNKRAGVLLPIPQYPLYSATVTEYNMHQIEYYLNEESEWSIDIRELERAYKQAETCCCPRGLVVINPGNPTGQVLSKENLSDVIKFAYERKLFILADEVYQHNTYKPTSRFHSMKKVLTELGEPYSKMELASFMSCSKGYLGECGVRGGYVEIINLCRDVKFVYHKLLSVNLCPSLLGQTVVDCMTDPPKPGDPSYGLFMQERVRVLESLLQRAKLVEDAFNSYEGFCCNPVQGAMYAYPKIDLPPKAIAEAKKRLLPPDVFYAFELLENTGICVVPGHGFGQIPGTHHFRTTILPQMDILTEMLKKFNKFHGEFLSRFR